jgi:ABC-type Zn uptake system ZnuABC Zn-binding protein ZnuA
MRLTQLAPLTAVLPALALSACGADSSAAGSDQVAVVATTGVAADIVAELAGDDAEVAQLVPDGASPHSYSPSAKEQQELIDAELLVYFSPRLEEALPIDASDNSLALAESSGDPGSPDPHVWLDPTRIEAALPALAEALSEIDPDNAEGYEQRAAAYAEQLRALDAELEQITDAVPEENRKLVSSHDLLGHFAERYGFEFIGAPFGLGPEAEAGAGGLAELIEAVEAERVPVVFAQTGDDPEVLRQVAEEAGVEVVDDLLLESLGDGADSYIEMLRLSTQRISDALSP